MWLIDFCCSCLLLLFVLCVLVFSYAVASVCDHCTCLAVLVLPCSLLLCFCDCCCVCFLWLIACLFVLGSLCVLCSVCLLVFVVFVTSTSAQGSNAGRHRRSPRRISRRRSGCMSATHFSVAPTESNPSIPPTPVPVGNGGGQERKQEVVHPQQRVTPPAVTIGFTLACESFLNISIVFPPSFRWCVLSWGRGGGGAAPGQCGCPRAGMVPTAYRPRRRRQRRWQRRRRRWRRQWRHRRWQRQWRRLRGGHGRNSDSSTACSTARRSCQ
jgi:hypothetical protein